MTLPTDIWIDFADGEYRFALLLPQQLELEKVCSFTDASGNQRRKGVIEIYGDVISGLGMVDGKIVADPLSGRASAFDCREVVRLALIGGGKGIVNGVEVNLNPPQARALCEAYLDTAPIVDRWTLAAAILKTACEGRDPPKKAARAKAPARPRRAKASASTK